MTNNIKQLTDEARRILECWSRGETTGTCADREAAASEALRIIDAHAAERAAMVEQCAYHKQQAERLQVNLLAANKQIQQLEREQRRTAAPPLDTEDDIDDQIAARDRQSTSARAERAALVAERADELEAAATLHAAGLVSADLATKANARVAELCTRREAAQRVVNAESERDAWKAKCEAAELDASAWRATADGEMKHRQAAESESAQWKAKCGAAERAYQDARSAYADLEESHKASERTVAQLNAMNDRAESEAAALRAELRKRELEVGREVKNVETLRAEVERLLAQVERVLTQSEGYKSRLTAATELLGAPTHEQKEGGT